MHNVGNRYLKYENYSLYDFILKSLNQLLGRDHLAYLPKFITEQLFEPGQ